MPLCRSPVPALYCGPSATILHNGTTFKGLRPGLSYRLFSGWLEALLRATRALLFGESPLSLSSWGLLSAIGHPSWVALPSAIGRWKARIWQNVVGCLSLLL